MLDSGGDESKGWWFPRTGQKVDRRRLSHAMNGEVGNAVRIAPDDRCRRRKAMLGTIGIDISKDTLDVHRHSDGRHARFGSDKNGPVRPAPMDRQITGSRGVRGDPIRPDSAVHSRHRPCRRGRHDRRDAGIRQVERQGGRQSRRTCGGCPRVGQMEGPVTDRSRTSRIAPGAVHARPGHDPPQHRTRPSLPNALWRRKTHDHRRDAKAPDPRQCAHQGCPEMGQKRALTNTDNLSSGSCEPQYLGPPRSYAQKSGSQSISAHRR